MPVLGFAFGRAPCLCVEVARGGFEREGAGLELLRGGRSG